MATILVTGFARFPGVPVNPTIALIAGLARRRRPALARGRVATHIFATRYAAVDAELPALIAREKPDAIVLFGVATKAKHIRIELVARNRASLLAPDAGGKKPERAMIAGAASRHRPGRFPLPRLRAAVRSTGLRTAVSRNAGAYLCNYAYWRALEAAAQAEGPRLVVLVHIPPPPTKARPRPPLTKTRQPRPVLTKARPRRAGATSRKEHRNPSLLRLARAGEAILAAVSASLDTLPRTGLR